MSTPPIIHFLLPYKNKKTQYGLIRLYPYRVVELYRTTVFRLETKIENMRIMSYLFLLLFAYLLLL